MLENTYLLLRRRVFDEMAKKCEDFFREATPEQIDNFLGSQLDILEFKLIQETDEVDREFIMKRLIELRLEHPIREGLIMKMRQGVSEDVET